LTESKCGAVPVRALVRKLKTARPSEWQVAPLSASAGRTGCRGRCQCRSSAGERFGHAAAWAGIARVSPTRHGRSDRRSQPDHLAVCFS